MTDLKKKEMIQLSRGKRMIKKERKEVEMERRIEKIENDLKKLKPDTYDFLLKYIKKQSEYIQNINFAADRLQKYIIEKNLADDFKAWLEAQSNTECEMCNGRGYIGDDEECPACHPNKN